MNVADKQKTMKLTSSTQSTHTDTYNEYSMDSCYDIFPGVLKCTHSIPTLSSSIPLVALSIYRQPPIISDQVVGSFTENPQSITCTIY